MVLASFELEVVRRFTHPEFCEVEEDAVPWWAGMPLRAAWRGASCGLWEAERQAVRLRQVAVEQGLPEGASDQGLPRPVTAL